jgi:hypothetical protein
MSPHPEADALARFRAALYATGLGHRKDSLFETLDAVLTAAGPETLARLSLAPGFRRGWASLPDALAAGQVRVDVVRALLLRTVPAVPSRDLLRPLWVVDASTWPRPEARTSPERTYCHRVTAGVPQQGIVAGWEYQWLVAVPEAHGSWILPLDVTRRPPPATPAPPAAATTPTSLAIHQLRATLAVAPDAAPRPVVTFDSGYDPVTLARAQQDAVGLAVDVLVRLASHRVLYREPAPYPGRGRPRTHGPGFRFKEPTTHDQPDREATLEHPDYGPVVVRAWAGLHVRHAPEVPFTVVCVQVGRLPRRARPPAPLWLAWVGGPLPDDLHLVWRWYLRRFTVEHGLRFAKQTLGWTTVRLRDPVAADRWTWLVALAFWHLWLARPLVATQRLPWEIPQPPEGLSPGRVRRAFVGLFVQVGTPARPPTPRGKSPGRRRGDAPGPHPRCAVVRRTPKRPTPRRKRRRTAA